MQIFSQICILTKYNKVDINLKNFYNFDRHWMHFIIILLQLGFHIRDSNNCLDLNVSPSSSDLQEIQLQHLSDGSSLQGQLTAQRPI